MYPRSNNLSVVLRPPELQVAIPSGAGRLLSNAYLAGGRFIGNKVNRLAHKMGHGPDFITNRIVEQLGNTGERLLRLAGLRVKPDRELERNCLKLMEYALPTETIAAQLKAFKGIVMLTTRFPGLRNVFLRCKHLRAAGTSKACIIELWRGSEDVSTTELEWNFFLKFAASCICDEDKLASMFDNVALDQLGSVPVDRGEYSIIERLLVASESSEKFESRMAVRYLGGILEFPSFWDQEFHANHETVTNKLFKKVGQLVNDLDVTSISPTRDAPNKIRVDFDLQGTDLLAFALMRGVSFWDQQSHFYFSAPVMSNFKDLVQLLQEPGAEYLLPRAYHAASYKWNRFLSATFTSESVEILVTDTGSAEALDKGDGDKITADSPSPRTHIDTTNRSIGRLAVKSSSNKLSVFSNPQSTDPRNLIRFSKIRAEAIATSVSRVIAEDERFLSGWTLFSPEELNTRIGDRFEEKILLLTVPALYIISYDYVLEKVKLYTRVPLGDIVGISKGAYILSTLEEASRDPVQNAGFVMTWLTSKQTAHITSYSLRDTLETPSTLPQSSQGRTIALPPSAEQTFAAFKVLPTDPAGTHTSESLTGSNLLYSEATDELSGTSNCQEVANLIVDSIRRACEDISVVGAEFVTNEDVVSLSQARRMTSVYAKMEYGVKRLLG